MTPDFHTHVRHFGHGPRAVLAIHCTLGHSAAWRGVGQALGGRLTLTAFDLPGHGQSDDWDEVVDLHRLCTNAALRYLSRPMDVIGHSFGATIALRLAVENPGLVRSLTLIEPVFFAAAMQDAPGRMHAYEREAVSYLEALEAGDMARAARAFNRHWGDGTRWEDIPQATRDYMTDRMHVVLGQSPMILEDNAGIMTPGMLEQVALPVLLLQGAQSPDIIDAVQESLANRLPNARRSVIAGAGHMVPLTHPQAVADEIATLLEVAEE